MPRLCAVLGDASLRLPPAVTAALGDRRGRPRPGRGGRLIFDRCHPCALPLLSCLASVVEFAQTIVRHGDHESLTTSGMWLLRVLTAASSLSHKQPAHNTPVCVQPPVRVAKLRRITAPTQIHVRAVWLERRRRRAAAAPAAQPLWQRDDAAAWRGHARRRGRGARPCPSLSTGAATAAALFEKVCIEVVYVAPGLSWQPVTVAIRRRLVSVAWWLMLEEAA